jgi:hypothetical protein
MAEGVKGEQILMVGVVAGGLYLLYQVIQGLKNVGSAAASAAGKVGSAVASAAETAATPIAAPIGYAAAALWKTWEWATSANIAPSGNVIMPDGSAIPVSQLALSFDDTYNVAKFAYQGRAYVIPQNPTGGPAYDQNGDYHAVSWDTFAASLGS